MRLAASRARAPAGAQRQFLYFGTSKASKVSTSASFCISAIFLTRRSSVFFTLVPVKQVLCTIKASKVSTSAFFCISAIVLTRRSSVASFGALRFAAALAAPVAGADAAAVSAPETGLRTAAGGVLALFDVLVALDALVGLCLAGLLLWLGWLRSSCLASSCHCAQFHFA